LAREEKGERVIWVVGEEAWERIHSERLTALDASEIQVAVAPFNKEPGSANRSGVDWGVVLDVLASRGVKSIMVEGGAKVIMDLLREDNQRFINSVIITIAPVWLGAGGVVVAPPKKNLAEEVGRLKDVKWIPMGEDVVMAGKFKERCQ
jgi:2,5-diamino-6-(ribosylamino)-4(3H)-pyrimidinone 5'-phosphate reductase